MECLDNLIVIKELCNPQDKTTDSRYIDSLPGLDLNVLSNWANLSDDETPEQVLQTKLNYTVKEAWYEILHELNTKKQLTVNTILSTETIGKIVPNDTLTPTKIDRGLTISKKKYQASRLAKIKINDVRIFSENSGTIKIFIQDGPTMTDYQYDVKAGINTFYIDYIADYDDVKVYTNTDTLILNNVALDEFIDDCKPCTTRTCNTYQYINNNPFEITISNVCYLEKLMCNMKDQIADVLLYYTAKEIVKEGMFSARLNADTLNQNKNEKLFKSFEESYNKKLSAITESLYNYLKHFDKYCIKCNGAKHSHFKAGGYDNYSSFQQTNV